MFDVAGGDSKVVHALGIAAVASVGIFLPVPIAFDVIITAILLNAGMPVEYAMTLLFTLGIFSVYSFSVIWKYISKPVAVTLVVGLAGLGMVSGVGAMTYHR
jgi:hypothetical protein